MTTETMTDAMRLETHDVLIESIGKNYSGRYCAVRIDGERIELRVPKGTRGVKAGATLTVRIEYREWFTMSRMTFNMREGTSTETTERMPYHDGAEHAHYYFAGLA